MGGVPWALDTNGLGALASKPTMVVGYDVHHKKGNASTVGLNATMDRNFCRYWSNAHKNGEQQEFSTKLQETLVRALNAFK